MHAFLLIPRTNRLKVKYFTLCNAKRMVITAGLQGLLLSRETSTLNAFSSYLYIQYTCLYIYIYIYSVSVDSSD